MEGIHTAKWGSPEFTRAVHGRDLLIGSLPPVPHPRPWHVPHYLKVSIPFVEAWAQYLCVLKIKPGIYPRGREDSHSPVWHWNPYNSLGVFSVLFVCRVSKSAVRPKRSLTFRSPDDACHSASDVRTHMSPTAWTVSFKTQGTSSDSRDSQAISCL